MADDLKRTVLEIHFSFKGKGNNKRIKNKEEAKDDMIRLFFEYTTVGRGMYINHTTGQCPVDWMDSLVTNSLSCSTIFYMGNEKGWHFYLMSALLVTIFLDNISK